MKAQFEVVVHAQVAVFVAGVLPGQAEHRVALIHQVADERVVRRQVEDVVLHDPGRHDQDRLGVHGRRGGRVLDQLHQAVLQHHLARRDAHVAPDHEVLNPRGALVRGQALQVIGRIQRAAQQVGAALLQRALQHHRVGGQLVAGREHVQPLAGGEGHHVFMVFLHALHAVRGGGPPLLLEQERLVQVVERPLLPFGGPEAPVLDGGLHAKARLLVGAGGHAFAGVFGQLAALVHGQAGQIHAFAGRRGQVQRPVAGGQQACGGGERGKPACQCGMEWRIHAVGHRRCGKRGVVHGANPFAGCSGNSLATLGEPRRHGLMHISYASIKNRPVGN